MYSLSEPATQSSSTEQFFRKLSGKGAEKKFLFSKAASCMVTVCSIIKKRPQYMCSPVNYAKFLRTSFFTEHLQVTFFTFCFMIEAKQEGDEVRI